MRIQVCVISQMNFDYRGNGEIKASLANPKHRYRVSQFREHVWVSKFLLFYRWTLIIGKWWTEKLLWQIQSINIMYPNLENMIVVPITKTMVIITSIQVWLISRMNINYSKNGEMKSLQIQSINILYPKEVNMIIVPNHKNNGYYYEYPSLCHFTDELWL